jgi:SAM-dependent methyltransferase
MTRMNMQEQKNIVSCYDKTAKAYADKYMDEMNYKHFDRLLLKSFAVENFGKGEAIDLGCGPGQTTKYLSDCGLSDILGVDISTKMIELAKELNPSLKFDNADILNLKYPDDHFGSAIAFYAIVHFSYEKLKIAFSEVRRVLAGKGGFLFSFHIGNETIHLDSFLGESVEIDFYFFEIAKIKDLLRATGFEIIDILEREPYKDIEYPSKRAYIWAKKME